MIDQIITQEIWLDGTVGRLFLRHWPAQGQSIASLVICHGFNAHSGHYARAAEVFAQRGIAVNALDLRGRGQSDGERFYVEHIDDYVVDLSQAIERARSLDPDLPLFLLGHSAGGVIACAYAAAHPGELRGLICESFAFQVPAPDFAMAALKGLSFVAPHAHVLHLKNELFSRDPNVVAAMNADPLIANEVQPTLTVAALVRADERLKREFPLITLPVLILHGTADKATKPSGSQRFYDTAGSQDKTLKLYEGHFHDLLNDVGKEAVMADIQQWIDAHIPAAREVA